MVQHKTVPFILQAYRCKLDYRTILYCSINVSSLMYLMQMQVFNSLCLITELSGQLVRNFVQPLVEYLPEVWLSNENLLKSQMFVLFGHVVKVCVAVAFWSRLIVGPLIVLCAMYDILLYVICYAYLFCFRSFKADSVLFYRLWELMLLNY